MRKDTTSLVRGLENEKKVLIFYDAFSFIHTSTHKPPIYKF